MGARYQDGKIGRFLSVDPAFLAVGTADLKQKTKMELEQYLADPQGLNGYSYARGNPLKNVDKSGDYFETIFDLTMFLWSYSDFEQDPNLKTGLVLAADGASIVLPIPAIVGAFVHGDDAAKILKLAPEAYKAARGLNWGNPAVLLKHTWDHANDFGLDRLDFKGYARVANDFITGADNAIKQGSKEFDTFLGKDGKTYFFEYKSSKFGVKNPDGTTATAYKAKGGDPQKALDYWNGKKKSMGRKGSN